MFINVCIAIESDADMELDEWLNQAITFLNATSFSATALAISPNMAGMASYVPEHKGNALENTKSTPAKRFRSTVYVPAAAAWILIFGKKNIYELCKEKKAN